MNLFSSNNIISQNLFQGTSTFNIFIQQIFTYHFVLLYTSKNAPSCLISPLLYIYRFLPMIQIMLLHSTIELLFSHFKLDLRPKFFSCLVWQPKATELFWLPTLVTADDQKLATQNFWVLTNCFSISKSMAIVDWTSKSV